MAKTARRIGVVVLSGDSSSRAFVGDVLDEIGATDGEAFEVTCGRTCIAALNLPVHRRLLVVDGAPPDLAAGALIEAARIVDPELPVLLIRYDWPGPAVVHRGVHVHPGPLASPACAALLAQLLSATAR